MRVPLPGGAYVNVAHISLLSAVDAVENRSNTFRIRILLMGSHEHLVFGDENTLRQLHARLVRALEDIDANCARMEITGAP